MSDLPLEMLAVCNDAYVLRIAASAVTQIGGVLSTVSSAEIATHYIGTRHVDGIIIDASLAHAVDLIGEIRNSRCNKQSAIFACVNLRAQGNAAIAAGATFVFHKPLVPETLAQVLRATNILMTERRRYMRYEVTAQVDLSYGRTQHKAVMLNLSEVGMAVRSPETFAAGKPVNFWFDLPNGPRIEGSGEIIWCSCTGVVGIAFQALFGTGNRDLPEWASKFELESV